MNSPNKAMFNRPEGVRAASKEILQSFLDTAREAVFVVDEAMRITASNVAAFHTFSRGNGPLDDRRLSEVIRDAGLHVAFRICIERQESTDLKLELGALERNTYDIHIAPFDLDGRRHAIGFFNDVTQVERLEKVRQEFLSNISHELRTPLTSIMAFVETLDDGALEDDENNRRFLTVIRRNAERMHSLIADILELSMIESGSVSIDKRRISPARLVEEIFDSLSAKAAERQIVLSHTVSPEARVFADPGRLEQMLINLIDNAIKFNRTAGCVEVSLKETEQRTVISVSDTGEGIITEHLGRIFERFYRLDRGRTREVGGTGLGLAIVKHLARLHGGEVTAESELGRGSAFHLELPLS